MTISKRTLGSRQVNPVGLGCMNICWAYGPAVADDYAIKLLNRALDIGYDHLDTARIYGAGKSEELIGTALKGRRSEYYLASKTGIIVDGANRGIDCRPETIKAGCEESLRLLQTDHIDLYYMHRRDFKTPIEESVGAMAELIKEGKIGGIGLSEMSADTLRRAHATHPITAMQTEYSLMTRQAEIAVLDTCKELGVTFVAFSRALNDISGQAIVFFVLVVAAAEVAVGLAIIVAIFRRRRSGATADDIDLLQG